MKLLTVFVVSLLALYSFSCGSSTPASQQAAENSADSFINLMFSSELEPCGDGTQTECDCPVSGTFTDDGTTDTYDICVSADNKTFSGTVTYDEATDTIDAIFSTFGDCTTVTTSGIHASVTSDCSGTITGTCAGETITCTLKNDATEEGCDCTF